MGLLTSSLLVVALAGSAATAGATPVDPQARKAQVDHNIVTSRAQLDETSQALVSAYDALQKTQGEVSVARAQLGAADGALNKAEAKNLETARQLEVARADEAKVADELTKNAAAAEQTQGFVGDIARHSYQSGGLGSWSMTLEALVNGDDPTAGVAMADSVLRYQKGVLQRLSTVRAEGTAQQDHLVGIRREVAHLKAKAAAGVIAAQQARDKASAAKGKLDQLEAQQRKSAAVVSARKQVETAELKSMQAESDHLEKILVARAKAARIRAAKAKAAAMARAKAARVAAATAAREARVKRTRAADAAAARAAAVARTAEAQARPASPGSSGPSAAPARGTGFLSYPVNGPLSSPFGFRFHPILHIEILHAGQDFAVACGTPVHAAADGDIVTTGWAGPSGQRVVIDHGLVGGVDLVTAYFHLSKILVRGGHVKRGQVIALSGTTGRSTGCHLHFETREDGVPVNPVKWL